MEREYAEEVCEVLKLALNNFNVMIGCFDEQSIDDILNDSDSFPLFEEYPFDESLDEVVSKLHSVAEKLRDRARFLKVGE